VFKNWGNLWIFSKSCFGVFEAIFVFVADWQIFEKKNKN
jgi:purine-cytosine permease-like protein